MAVHTKIKQKHWWIMHLCVCLMYVWLLLAFSVQKIHEVETLVFLHFPLKKKSVRVAGINITPDDRYKIDNFSINSTLLIHQRLILMQEIWLINGGGEGESRPTLYLPTKEGKGSKKPDTIPRALLLWWCVSIGLDHLPHTHGIFC